MSLAAPVSHRSYALHGVGLTFSADEPAVLDAIDIRLRDYARTPDPAIAQLRLTFARQCPERDASLGEGRPVYETPDGGLSYYAGSDLLSGELGGVRLSCDAAGGTAVFTAESFSGRDLYLATHPLTTLALMELLERRGLFTLHAACLASPGGDGVLLAGPSGAGKSTLTLALAHAGMQFVSDDIVLLGEAGVRAFGFADAIGITDDTARWFPRLGSLLDDPPLEGFPKRLRRIEELFGRAPLGSCKLGALVFPEVAPELPSAIAPLDPGEAFLRLVPDVLLTESAATRAHLAAIAALLEHVRCYTVLSGCDLERAAELVRGVAGD